MAENNSNETEKLTGISYGSYASDLYGIRLGTTQKSIAISATEKLSSVGIEATYQHYPDIPTAPHQIEIKFTPDEMGEHGWKHLGAENRNAEKKTLIEILSPDLDFRTVDSLNAYGYEKMVHKSR